MKSSLNRALSLGCSFLLSVAAVSAQITVTGLCNNGLTPASPITGCTTSTPVTPVNPVSGGTRWTGIGNWRHRTPQPHTTIRKLLILARGLLSDRPGWMLRAIQAG